MFSISFKVEKSIEVNQSPEKIFDTIADFNNWGQWSPWLCQEPECPVNISGVRGEVGHKQAWNGKLIGSGNMQLESLDRPKYLEYQLQFLKPWKSKSKVSFRLSEVRAASGDKEASQAITKVTWLMDSTLPIFLFWMKKMMIAFIGMDYERGLIMLKDLIENGNVPTKVIRKGVVQKSKFYFKGKRKQCSIDEVGPEMQQDFSQLEKLMNSSTLAKPDFTFSVYHKWDMVNRSCEYTAGFGYYDEKDMKPKTQADLVEGEIEGHKALQIDHLGPYRYLGNAWSTIMALGRDKSYKEDKKIDMYEVYKSMPGQVPDDQITTELFYPLK